MTNPAASFSSLSSLSLDRVALVHGGISRGDLANILAPATEERDRCLVGAKGNSWETQVCNTRFLETVSRGLNPSLGDSIPQTSQPVCDRTRSGCFAAGTLVRTLGGMRVIEELGSGDLVLSRDGDVTRIRATTRAVATEIVRVVFGDSTRIDTTPRHRFFDVRGDLVAAEQLVPGSFVRAHDGAAVGVRRVERIDGNRVVYNLAVERGMSFYANGKPVESAHVTRVFAPKPAGLAVAA